MKSTIELLKEHLVTADLARERADTTAEVLGMSGTTMRRQLRKSGTTYKAMLDAERKKRCFEIMSQTPRNRRGKLMLDACGYAEVNSFYRAFHRWQGVTFMEFRRSAA